MKKNFFKRNCKNIIIIILVLFSLNRCTVCCNRSYQINKSDKKIKNLDSIINIQSNEIFNLKRDIIEYQNRLGIYDKFNEERNKQDSIENERLNEYLKYRKENDNKK